MAMTRLARGGTTGRRSHPNERNSALDAIGPVMGMATIPMALLSLASVVAGAALLVFGDWRLVVGGVAAAAFCYLLARPLERVAIATDDRAVAALRRGRRARARGFAAVSGVFPTLVILLAEMLIVRLSTTSASFAPLVWLWAYGVATGPWTLWAARVSRFRRTLASIRAYAGHVALWLLALALVAGAPYGIATAVGLLAAWLPVSVGVLLAMADRGAISDVRI